MYNAPRTTTTHTAYRICLVEAVNKTMHKGSLLVTMDLVQKRCRTLVCTISNECDLHAVVVLPAGGCGSWCSACSSS